MTGQRPEISSLPHIPHKSNLNLPKPHKPKTGQAIDINCKLLQLKCTGYAQERKNHRYQKAKINGLKQELTIRNQQLKFGTRGRT